MKKIKIKNILIVMLITIEVIATYFMYKSSINKEVVLDNVELKELTDKSSFAIYLDGKEYTTSTTWPASATFEKAECQNEKGDIVTGALTFNEDENKVYLNNTTQTTYCYLYFSSPLSLGRFCNDQTNMKTCMNNKKSTIGEVENMTSSEVGGMYRYQGTDNVNNWICFGTIDKTQCTGNIDKYMYRIIGVTKDGELALIKEKGVKELESTNRVFYWNNKYSKTACESDDSGCTWANSNLYNRLNGLCKSDNINCSGTGSGRSGQTNIFIGNSYYEYLTNESIWLDKISNHTWKYGDSKELESYNGDSAYSIESQFPNSIDEAKIGLMYVHDYYYAYPGGNPGNYVNTKNAWIHNSEISYEWLISRYGVNGTRVTAWFVYSSGGVDDSYLNNAHGVRPVFYLKSDIKISNTAGSKKDPFIIDIAGNTPAPTCTLSVSSSGVTMSTSNATEYGLVSNTIGVPLEYVTKTYNSKTTLALETNKSYFGLVKNSGGEAYCAINVWGPDTEAGTCAYSSGGVCTLYNFFCECGSDHQWHYSTYSNEEVGNCIGYSSSPSSTCSGQCDPELGQIFDSSYCTCNSTGGPVGWVCGYDGNIRGNYTSQTDCEEKCVFGETSCTSGTQVTSGGNVYCWSKRVD